MVVVEAVCAGQKLLGELAAGCKLVRMPRHPLCRHSRLYHRAAIPDVLGIYRPNCHQPCVQNELVSIFNRVCGKVPEPTPKGLAALAKTMGMLARDLPVLGHEELDSVPLHYTGAKRTRYQQAVDDLRAHPLVPRDASIKAFVKAEKTDFSKKENPDPRMIQARSMRYNCLISQFLNPIERWLYTNWKSPYTNLPMIGKCLNLSERADMLQNKMSCFRRPVVVSLDASRFDQHVSREQLQLEHRFYLRMNPSRMFAWLLRMQLDNKCATTQRIKYKTRGKRMSGDKNTAVGNCVDTIIMVATVMRWLGIHAWDVLDDGDDCLLIMEHGQLPRFKENCQAMFLQFGHEMKVENIAYDMAEVEWCQCKPVELSPGQWKFVRKPLKVLSTTLTGVSHWQEKKTLVNYIHTLGVCEMIMSQGVPVLQAFAESIIRNSAGGQLVKIEEYDPLFYRFQSELRDYNLKFLARVPSVPISTAARMSFAKAFGIEPALQRIYEQQLGQWQFDWRCPEFLGLEWTNDGGWHSLLCPPYEVSLGRRDE